MVYVWALASGLLFAVAAVLQHREARTQPPQLALTFGLVAQLARRPRWLAANVIDFAGAGAETLALAAGPLIAVQALKTSGVLFALASASWLGSRPLTARQWAAAVVLTTALCVFLLMGRPSAGAVATPAAAWLVVTATTAALVATIVALARRARPPTRCLAYGTATGVIWAFTAASLKTVVNAFRRVGFNVVLHPAVWFLVAGSTVGTVLNQSAFQAGDIAWSLPAISVVEPVVGSVFGVALFGERFQAHGAPAVALTVTSAVLALGGVVFLTRDPSATHSSPSRV